MDWSTQEVVQWLEEKGLSKYTKRFKGYSVNGAVLLQMDETLLDDLEVTDINDRKILLTEVAKLNSSKTDELQLLFKKKKTRSTVKNHQIIQTPVIETPVITVSNFDDNDSEQRLDPISDDEEETNDQRTGLAEELPNQRIINLSYSGDESTTDDGSERDFSFKDSDEEHDIDIYDESKDKTGDLSLPASVVASRATRMVEMLSCDNVALREKLESVYLKLNNLQMVECELESMRSAYNELEISYRKRESLEWSARAKMETADMGKLKEKCKQLQDELQKCKDEVQQEKKSLEKCRSDQQLKNNVIRQLISQSNSFAFIRDDLENTINDQRQQIEELLSDKEQLYSSLVQSRERTAYLEKELNTNHVNPSRKARSMHVTQRIPDTADTRSEETITNHLHSISSDEGIAELDGPISVPILLDQLKEKDERIQVLGDKLLRLEQTLQQEGTSRNLAIRAVSMPKEARIAALEKAIQESEKIIAECRGQNLRSIEELYVANRRCADLEVIIKSLHSQLSEKSARIRFLENNNEHDEGDDEPSEPEWLLDPAFCRTDFAHIKDLARDSYAESLDSGMSLTNTIDMRHTDPELKTMDEPDQVSVHFWSV